VGAAAPKYDNPTDPAARSAPAALQRVGRATGRALRHRWLKMAYAIASVGLCVVDDAAARLGRIVHSDRGRAGLVREVAFFKGNLHLRVTFVSRSCVPGSVTVQFGCR
jgi:hypothetical protein